MKTTFKYILLLCFGFVLTSCRTDESEIISSYLDSEQIRFGANLEDMILSRGLPQSGMINEGELNVTYLKSDGKYDIGKVIFTNGTGFSFRFVGSNTYDLLWGDIAPSDVSQQTYNFYFDNLAVEDTTKYGYLRLPEGHPYRFCKFKPGQVDAEGNEIPSPDLIWGSLIDTKKSHSLTISLSHVMSLFTLRINIDKDGFDNNGRKPKRAWISNLRHEAKTFNRMSGDIDVADPNVSVQELDPIMLVDNGEEIYASEDWKYNDEEHYYDSPQFIIPPQMYTSGYRPRLTIELEDGTKYSGLLPQFMYIEDGNGAYFPRVLEFLKGYKIAFSVTITSEANHLVFMPAYLYTWFGKGTQNITGYQACLDDEKSFEALFAAYDSASNDSNKNAGDKYGFYKWGYLDETNNRWVFNIFQNQSLNESDIRGEMIEDPELPYSFLLHYATVTILMENGDEIALTAGNNGAEKLKALLNNGSILSEEEEKED